MYRNTSSVDCELMAQSTQNKTVIAVPIKDIIHPYSRALFYDIPRVGTQFNKQHINNTKMKVATRNNLLKKLEKCGEMQELSEQQH